MLMKVISRQPLRYAGKLYATGDTVEVAPKDARVLVAIRKVVPAEAPAEQTAPEPVQDAKPKGKPGPKPKGKPGPKPKAAAEPEPPAAEPEPPAAEPDANEPNEGAADAMDELLGIDSPAAPRRVGYKRRDMVAEGE